MTSGHLLKRHSKGENNQYQTRYISDLIKVNPRLHSVDLGQFLFKPEVVTRFCSVLRNYTKIQELCIVCPTFSDPFHLVWQLLWSSFRLESCASMCATPSIPLRRYLISSSKSTWILRAQNPSLSAEGIVAPSQVFIRTSLAPSFASSNIPLISNDSSPWSLNTTTRSRGCAL